MSKDLDDALKGKDAEGSELEELPFKEGEASSEEVEVSGYEETDPRIRGPEPESEPELEMLDTVEVTPEQVAEVEQMGRQRSVDPLESTREFPVLEAEEFWFIHNDPPAALEVGEMVTIGEVEATILSCVGIQTYERQYSVSVEGHETPLLLKQGVNGAKFVRYEMEHELFNAIDRDSPASAGVPKSFGFHQDEVCQYLLCEPSPGLPYSQLLDNRGVTLREHVYVLIQLVEVLREIHRAGFILTSIRPASFNVGAAPEYPVYFTSFLNLIHAVECPPYALASPFTAPEITENVPGDEGVDYFSVGALLYRSVTGQDLSGDQIGRVFVPSDPRAQAPMVFQTLIRTLSPPTERFLDILDLEKALKQLHRELEPRLHYEVAVASSTGINPLRIVNQDSAGYLETKRLHRSTQMHLGFYCVADGMGGHEAGDRASELAVEGALHKFNELALSTSTDSWERHGPSLCKEIASTGSAHLVATAEEEGLGKKMGTTFTAGLVVDDTLSIAHLGDSRAILFRDGEHIILTEDHSLVAMMVKAGQITPEQAERAEEKNILIRSIGADQVVNPRLFDGLEVLFDKTTLKLQDGDCIIFVSDGVWSMASRQDMKRVVDNHTTADNLCHQLCQVAIRQGGLDNVVVLAIKARDVQHPRF